jgi:hypothetical protein
MDKLRDRLFQEPGRVEIGSTFPMLSPARHYGRRLRARAALKKSIYMLVTSRAGGFTGGVRFSNAT